MNVEDHYLIFFFKSTSQNEWLFISKCPAQMHRQNKKISTIIIIRRVCAWFRTVSLKIADACFKEMSRWICEHRLTTSIYKMDDQIGGWMKNKNIHKVIDSLDSFLAAWKLWRSSVASVGVFMSIYFFYIIFYCFLYVKVSLSLLSRNGMNSPLYKWSKESDFLIRFYFLFRKLCKHVRVIETFFINLHRFSSILCVCVCAVAVTFTIIIKCLLPFSNKERSISRLNFVYLNSILRSFSLFHFFVCLCAAHNVCRA